ncbi:MAG: hypothetical protein H0T69_06210 [Thermoleophilaceae bacterium]|nr:hypothetical protein [Thermoleophilaceae bacterium]
MPSELNRRAVFAAAAAFLAALAVAYGLSSPGQASEGSGPPGSPAEPLDVASGLAGQTTLGQAEALPSLVRRPKPPAPKASPVKEDVAPPAETPAPTVDPQPTYVAPTPAPTPTPTPSPPTQPPIEFEDSG